MKFEASTDGGKLPPYMILNNRTKSKRDHPRCQRFVGSGANQKAWGSSEKTECWCSVHSRGIEKQK